VLGSEIEIDIWSNVLYVWLHVYVVCVVWCLGWVGGVFLLNVYTKIFIKS